MHGCAEKRKKTFSAWEWVCQIFSPRDTRFPHLDTHSQLPAARSVSAPGLLQRLHFLLCRKKKVGAVGEECVFSLRVALHERFQTGNNHPRHKERALLSLLGGVARGELKDWNLVIGTNRQRKRTRCLRERSIFFFPPHELYRNAFSVGPSIRPESITTFRRVHHTFTLRESQLAWVQDREGSYRQLANMERQTI